MKHVIEDSAPDVTSDGGVRKWIRANPDLASQLPPWGIFTANAIDGDASGILEKARNASVIEAVGKERAYGPNSHGGTSQKTMTVWGVTPEAVHEFQSFEGGVTEERSPLPCGHISFVNVGPVEGAPTDEPYILCHRCDTMYPRGQL